MLKRFPNTCGVVLKRMWAQRRCCIWRSNILGVIWHTIPRSSRFLADSIGNIERALFTYTLASLVALLLGLYMLPVIRCWQRRWQRLMSGKSFKVLLCAAEVNVD